MPSPPCGKSHVAINEGGLIVCWKCCKRLAAWTRRQFLIWNQKAQDLRLFVADTGFKISPLYESLRKLGMNARQPFDDSLPTAASNPGSIAVELPGATASFEAEARFLLPRQRKPAPGCCRQGP